MGFGTAPSPGNSLGGDGGERIGGDGGGEGGGGGGRGGGGAHHPLGNRSHHGGGMHGGSGSDVEAHYINQNQVRTKETASRRVVSIMYKLCIISNSPPFSSF